MYRTLNQIAKVNTFVVVFRFQIYSYHGVFSLSLSLACFAPASTMGHNAVAV